LSWRGFLYFLWNLPEYLVVPGAGIEPARLAAGDFESPASTNFTTRASNFADPPIAIEQNSRDRQVSDYVGNRARGQAPHRSKSTNEVTGSDK
jgi:hypothetical protein